MRRISALVFLISSLAASAAAANEVPDWVRAGLTQKAPSYPSKVSSVELLREESWTVEADGRRIMRERGMIRVLQSGGDKFVTSRTYDSKNGRIRDFQGWLVPRSGKVTSYTKDRIVDVAVVEGVYEESRKKMLVCDS